MTLFLFLGAAAAQAGGLAEHRGWLPNNGTFSTPLGDAYYLLCSHDGTVTVSADTIPDDDRQSRLDLFLQVVDAQGQAVATGDDEIACSATPVCGFSCPLTQFFCQSNEVYTVMVSDYGASGRTCNAGGQYVLRAEGAATAGRSIDVFLLGNVRNLQPSARAIGLDAVAPFVDAGPIVRVFDHGAGTTVPGKGE